MFKKTAKQEEATRLMAGHLYTLLVGGSRSGKTFITLRNMFIRGFNKSSRHVIFRKHFKDVKGSIHYETFPDVCRICFPDIRISVNKTDWFYTFGDKSEIWLGGLDDKERTDNILGKEYSTIWFNECSQLGFDEVETALSRLAEDSGLALRAWFDENPPSKKHWTYKLFIEGVHPETGKKVDAADYAWLLMNPHDNLENIHPDYIEKVLNKLGKRKRDRFLLGKFLTDVEGALWSNDMVLKANSLLDDFGSKRKTIVSLDPATTFTATSDEIGIHVGSLEDTGERVLIEADYTLKGSPETWGRRAVRAYHDHGASYIVAEGNQGGDLVKTVINGIDASIPVRIVYASTGKFARAEPIALKYEQGKVIHAPGLDKTEEEMLEWVPHETKKSPNRIDSVVWLVWDLLVKPKRTYDGATRFL
jgi:hypothetical protein